MSAVEEIEAAISKLPADDQRKLRERLARVEDEAPVMSKLSKMAGAAKGLPPDLAINHDHYLHGVEKRIK